MNVCPTNSQVPLLGETQQIGGQILGRSRQKGWYNSDAKLLKPVWESIQRSSNSCPETIMWFSVFLDTMTPCALNLASDQSTIKLSQLGGYEDLNYTNYIDREAMQVAAKYAKSA